MKRVVIFLIVIFILFLITIPIDTQEVQQQLELWGINSTQIDDRIIIQDLESNNTQELSYNLSYLMTSLDFILEESNEDVVLNYIYTHSDVVIENEWFSYYRSLEKEEEKLKAIKLLLDSIEGE